MLNESELQVYLHQATQHPEELLWAAPLPGSTPTLPTEGMFRPGEMIAIHIHPTGDGPPLPEGLEPEPHRHEFIEIPYLWEGQCQMEVEGQTFPMNPGDFIILDTRSAHRPKVEPGALLLNLAIQPAFFNDAFFRQFSKDDALAGFFANTIYSQKSAKRYLIFETHNDLRIRRLLTMILQEYFSREVCSRSIVENFVTVLFSTMVRLQLQKSVNVTAMEQVNDDLVTEVLRYMEENLQTVTREALADHFGYSYSYMTTVLQTATGMTFSKLKNTLRLQRAELLLRTTDRPITQVAHDAGFSNVTSFYEMFRSSYGAAPLDYRKSLVQQKLL